MTPDEPVISEDELDEALDVAHEQADVAASEAYSAGFRCGAEFVHRYLIERERLSHDHD